MSGKQNHHRLFSVYGVGHNLETNRDILLFLFIPRHDPEGVVYNADVCGTNDKEAPRCILVPWYML